MYYVDELHLVNDEIYLAGARWGEEIGHARPRDKAARGPNWAAGHMTTDTTESKALRLARYLKEFVGLRSTTIRDVAKYESVLWFGEMPQEPECRSPSW